MALCKVYTMYGTRSVGAGGAGVATVTPDFVSFVNLISTRGQILPTKLTVPPDFQTFQRPCSQKEAAAEVLKKRKSTSVLRTITE